MSCRNAFLALCRRALACALFAGAVAAPAWAQTRAALLVGVAEYPAATGAKPLPGTTNDVELMRTVLLRAGFRAEDITILADQHAGAASPTRDNILGALRRMAAGAKPGDYYYLHFSGHGSQQPEDPKARARRPEPDGLNEIFLPIDIGKWDSARSTVDNAIRNYELDEILDQFLARGAFVWAVFDACHSAALMRGGPDDEVTLREVDPQALGIPARAMEQAAAGAVTTRGDADAPMGALAERKAAPGKSGGYVAFYAAQTTEAAPEMAMPANLVAGHPDRKRHGVLTYTLAEALTTNPQASYRQVSQLILSRYSSQYISNKPTPIFTGSHLDAPVFGRTLASPVRQWQITRGGGKLTIPAGRLAQLGEGALLAVMGNPAAPTDKALGRLRVTSAGLFASQVAAVPDADDKTIAEDKIPDGAYARLVRPAIDLQLRVAQPAFSARTPEPARRKVETAVQALRQQPSTGTPRIEWLPAGRVAEIRLHEEDGQLWLLPASGALVKSGPSKTLSIKLDHDDAAFAALLADSLARIAKAVNLIRVAEQIPGGGVAGVDIRIDQLPPAGGPAKVLTSVGTRLRGGDKVGFTITNRSRTPVDVTILYIDSRYGIEPIFPHGAENNRIEPGAVLRAGPGGLEPITLDDDTVGTERLVVIVSSTVAQGERIDYTYLAQPRLDATRGTRGPSSNLLDLFDEAAFGVTTRSAVRARDEQAAMQVYTWDVRKR